MKLLDAFKSYTSEEDAERLAELHNDSPENSAAIRHKCWDNYNQGVDKGVLLVGVASLATYGGVKLLEFISNRKNK